MGSFTSGDNRLDSQLAGAVMGIQAIKGVEIGDGFETARRRGSVAHDEIYPGPDGVMRSTNRAGGLEGGMTNGQALRVRAAMKPISTVPRALATIDMSHRRGGRRDPPALRRVRGARRRRRRRDDGGAGAGAGGAGEVRRRLARRDQVQRRRLPQAIARIDNRRGYGLMAPKAVLVGMPGSGKSTIGRRLAKALDVPLLDTDAKIVETTGRTIADIFVEGEAEFRRIEADVVCAALAEHDGVVSLGGGAITTPEVREALGGPHRHLSGNQCGRRHSAHLREHRSARCSPAAIPAERFRELMTQRVPLYREVATMRINTNRRNPGAVVRHIVHKLEAAECGRQQAVAQASTGVAPAAHRPESGTHHRGAAESRGVGPSSGGAQ